MLLVLPSTAQAPGSIVFASRPILSGGEPGPPGFVFRPSDPIYAVAIFAGPLRRLPVTRQVTLSLKVFEKSSGGAESFLDYYDIGLSGSAMEATSLSHELAPEPAESRSYSNPEWHFGSFGKKVDGPAAMCDILAGLPPGRHLLVLRLEQDYEPVASGELLVEASDFGVYAQRAQLLRQARPKS